MILRGSYLEVIVSDTCRKQSSAYLMVGIRSWWEEYYCVFCVPKISTSVQRKKVKYDKSLRPSHYS